MASWPPKQRQTNTESVSKQLNLIVFSDKIILDWFNTIEFNHNNKLLLHRKKHRPFWVGYCKSAFWGGFFKTNMNLYRACCFCPISGIYAIQHNATIIYERWHPSEDRKLVRPILFGVCASLLQDEFVSKLRKQCLHRFKHTSSILKLII